MKFDVEKTSTFNNWLQSLDRLVRARITRRLERLEAGAFGDVAPVGDGVSELRFHFGPGYRVYFIRAGSKLLVVLGGGDKATQVRDIASAKALAEAWRRPDA